jgi:hypothetical protein
MQSLAVRDSSQIYQRVPAKISLLDNFVRYEIVEKYIHSATEA